MTRGKYSIPYTIQVSVISLKAVASSSTVWNGTCYLVVASEVLQRELSVLVTLLRHLMRPCQWKPLCQCCAVGGEGYQGNDFISSVLHESNTCGWPLLTLQSCFTPEKDGLFVFQT